MNLPKLIEGGKHSDDRGNLFFNNSFNTTEIKRIYFIENKDVDFERGWTGHQVEQRWFVATQGSFIIKLIKIDNWDKPSKDLSAHRFELTDNKMDVLFIPKGYASSIQSKEKGSRLLVMADYSLGEINDEFRFPIDYFEKIK